MRCEGLIIFNMTNIGQQGESRLGLIPHVFDATVYNRIDFDLRVEAAKISLSLNGDKRFVVCDRVDYISGYGEVRSH